MLLKGRDLIVDVKLSLFVAMLIAFWFGFIEHVVLEGSIVK